MRVHCLYNSHGPFASMFGLIVFISFWYCRLLIPIQKRSEEVTWQFMTRGFLVIRIRREQLPGWTSRFISLLRELVCHVGSQSFNCHPTDRGRRCSHHNPRRSWYSIYRPRMDERLSWPKQVIATLLLKDITRRTENSGMQGLEPTRFHAPDREPSTLPLRTPFHWFNGSVECPLGSSTLR